MKIAILHGYGLSGSGSNLYTCWLSRWLSKQGHTVHVICQHRDESIPSHVSKIVDYDLRGEKQEEKKIANAIDGLGSITVHRPFLGDVLPVYNWDRYPGFDCVKTFLGLNDDELEKYVAYFTEATRRVVETEGIELMHANHVLASPEVARRVKGLTGCPYILTPHGSAIEYIVKKNEKYLDLAHKGMCDAERVLVGGEEMFRRIEEVWGQEFLEGLSTDVVPVGVDLQKFAPRDSVDVKADDLVRLFSIPQSKGGSRARDKDLFEKAAQVSSDEQLLELVAEQQSAYERKTTDADIVEKLRSIAWGEDRVVAFAGKLVAGKGLQALIPAFLGVLEEHPNSHLLLAGEGSFREALTLLLHGLCEGRQDIVDRVLRLGWAFDRKPQQELSSWKQHQDAFGFEQLHQKAKALDLQNRVHFLGYFSHDLLGDLLRVSDLLVLPSIVKEAYPLSLMEALAVGLVTVSTNHGGVEAFYDAVLPQLPAERGDLRVRPDKQHIVEDLKLKISGQFRLPRGPVPEARDLAERLFGWGVVAKKTAQVYERAISSHRASAR